MMHDGSVPYWVWHGRSLGDRFGDQTDVTVWLIKIYENCFTELWSISFTFQSVFQHVVARGTTVGLGLAPETVTPVTDVKYIPPPSGPSPITLSPEPARPCLQRDMGH